MRGVAVLTITGVLSQLVGFVYRIGLTRLAGAEILGLYQLILPVYSVLLSLTSVGLTTAVSNLSAWYQALGNQRAIYQVRGQAVKLFFLLALMAHPPGPLSAADGDGKSPETLFLRHGPGLPRRHHGAGGAGPPVPAGAGPAVAPGARHRREGRGDHCAGHGPVRGGLRPHPDGALPGVLGASGGSVRGETDPQGPPGQDWADRPAPGVCGPAGESHLLGQRGAHPPAAGPGGNGPGGGGVGLRRDLWHDAAHALAAHGLSQRFGAGTHPQALPVFRPGTEGGHPPAGEAVGGGGQSDPHSRPGPAGGAGLGHRAEPVPG